MATANQKQEAKNPLRISAKSIELLEQHVKNILDLHKRFSDMRNKLEAIDLAYFRFQTEDDKNAGKTQAGVALDNIKVPILISQVDGFVGHMAEVYLSGYPMFPIVSSPADMKEAEMLESIIDTHAIQGQYAREFLLSFRDGIKYNFMPIECSWEPIEQYQIVTDYLKPREQAQMKQSFPSFTRIKRRSPYNTIWDPRYNPAEVAYCGEWAGYIELEGRIPMKRFINSKSQSGNLYNLSKVQSMTFPNTDSMFYTEEPEVNELVSANQKRNAGNNVNWMNYLTGNKFTDGRTPKTLFAGLYEKTTLYLRIIPSEFNIEDVPAKNSPQIWKIVMLNGQTIIYVERVYTAYDILPMMIGMPLEDGFGIQTKSIGEAQIPIQNAISTMFDIRFNAARRAVSDRAIYNDQMISSDDINAPIPAPKIPVRLSGLNDRTLSDAYMQIPFDARGTEGVMQDAGMLLEFADKLSGQNKPSRGEFQKGNKSVVEWQDTMSGADERRRLPVMTVEYQIMTPIKESIKLNIFQKGVNGPFQSQKTGTVYSVTPEMLDKLRQKVLSFRVADGYTPKSKLASTDMLGNLIQAISQSELLAASWGQGLPAMFAHLGQLGGVRGLEQYLPQPQGAPSGQPNAGGATKPPASAPVT